VRGVLVLGVRTIQVLVYVSACLCVFVSILSDHRLQHKEILQTSARHNRPRNLHYSINQKFVLDPDCLAVQEAELHGQDVFQCL